MSGMTKYWKYFWKNLKVFKGELPLHAFKKAGELGFGAIYCSEEYNGAGLGRYEAALAFEQLAGGCTSTAAYMAVHNMVC